MLIRLYEFTFIFSIVSVSTLLPFANAQTKYVKDANTVKLAVYYESLCPDSRDFITNVLGKVYAVQKVNIRFIPFGRAKLNADGSQRSCQHGDLECLGNLIHACTLERLNTDDSRLSFVVCAMNKVTIRGQQICIQRERVVRWGDVVHCAFGRQGKRLMLKHGKDTMSQLGRPNFIPTIIFNQQKYDEEDQQAIFKMETLKALISKYKS